MSQNPKLIKIVGAKEHNLKNIDINIPKDELVVVTGLSGSGKSSLIFDTIYAEAQRKYVESLSAYARQFLDLQDKPDVELISGLSPAIAIEQKNTSRNPRSTVGTVTEIYDYFRLLFARIGIPHSPETDLPLKTTTSTEIVDEILKLPNKTKIYILSPLAKDEEGDFRKELNQIKKQGFQRVKIDGQVYEVGDIPKLVKTEKHTIDILVDRIVINPDIKNRAADSTELALKMSEGSMMVEIFKIEEGHGHKKGDIIMFSEKLVCPDSGFTFASDIEPRMFSFNSPYGVCRKCNGLGEELYFDYDLIVKDKNLSLREGAISIWQGVQDKKFKQILAGLSNKYKFSLDVPFFELSKEVQDIIFNGTDEEVEFEYEKSYRSVKVNQKFTGVIAALKEREEGSIDGASESEVTKYQNLKQCSSCKGGRLNREALSIKINNLNIHQVCDKSVADLKDWINNINNYLSETHQQISEKIQKEINKRLEFLTNVGLDYLAINRKSNTLSGGEFQRIRLASQIGSGLSGVIYVLDEPSIGLHQSDNQKLINTLHDLKNMGNSVLVVEHDEEMMKSADYLIDVGPGAGIYGGEIISAGKPNDVINDPNSVTGAYLSGKKTIQIPEKTRNISKKNFLEIIGCTANNLKNVDLKVPLGVFVAVCGVSGGGKSSLIIETLCKALTYMINKSKANFGAFKAIYGVENIDKIIEIDQSPIGRTPRSNPATYIGAFTLIRDLFTELPESRMRGYKSGRFSFNVKGGRCETCQGDGVTKIEMNFLPDLYIKCHSCKGKRYNRETLEVLYKGKSISDILEMNAAEAEKFFKAIPQIHIKFKALCDVGLNYVKIGQSATTLSGGEAQRIKLARELSKKSTGKTMYILDEPTTGLHFDDTKKLLDVLHILVDEGNTVLVIEHNLDVIKTADHVIDIGPCGGAKGGYIVAEGVPSKIAKDKKSVTGKYLAEAMKISVK
jgi:excinuclease ABC subunit A